MIPIPDSTLPLLFALLTCGQAAHPDLSGRWRVNVARSDDPFTMLSFDSTGAATRPQGASGGYGNRSGGGGFGGGRGAGGRGMGGMGSGRRGGGSRPARGDSVPPLSESQRQGFRQALRMALYAQPLLQIAQTDSSMTFGGDTLPLVLFGDGRTVTILAVDSTADVRVTARWLGNSFLVSRQVVGGGRVTEDYVKSADGGEITVYVHFDGGVGRSLDFRRVYEPVPS